MDRFSRCGSVISALVLTVLLGGCVAGSTSETANAMADKAMYKPVDYVNRNVKGVPLVVLPGQIKSNNATFAQKYGSNNIADMAELELGKANFPVLERANLGPMLKEVEIAYNLGDPGKARKLFQMGKFKTTKYIMVFDVLKAEPVAQASSGFDGKALGNFISESGGRGRNASGNRALGGLIGSIKTEEAAGVWIVGLRYKLLDANTTQQEATGYFEDKMEVSSQGSSVMGISQSTSGGVTLDTMVQRLVQQAVAEVDARYKGKGR